MNDTEVVDSEQAVMPADVQRAVHSLAATQISADSFLRVVRELLAVEPPAAPVLARQNEARERSKGLPGDFPAFADPAPLAAPAPASWSVQIAAERSVAVKVRVHGLSTSVTIPASLYDASLASLGTVAAVRARVRQLVSDVPAGAKRSGWVQEQLAEDIRASSRAVGPRWPAN